MANTYFSFKKFTVKQEHCAMKVSTDACLFGAWCAREITSADYGGKRLLDIGTGTGLLSLMVDQKANVNIDAVEIDAAAALQAAQNISDAHAFNIRVHHEDILNFNGSQYHYIISNPPFYENELPSPSATRALAHHHAGLYWRELFRIIAEKLLPDGNFFLLLPYKRALQLEPLLNAHSLFIEKKIAVQHSAHHLPNRLLIKGSKKKERMAEENLIVMLNENYSPQFILLLKDYYMHL